MDGMETTGYDLVDVENGKREPFLRVDGSAEYKKIGKFTIIPSGLVIGKRILHSLIHGKNKIAVIDEVGALELRNEGWAESLGELLEKTNNHMLLVVRDEFVEQVIEKWNLHGSTRIDIDRMTPTAAADLIVKQITTT
jgi:iron complex transport system ATP-binding protein